MRIRLWMTLGTLLTSSALMAESFSESVSVLEVQVPVQVTLGQEAVRGLTVESFEVYDRGRRQEILSFRVMDLSTTTEVTETTVEAAREPAPDGRNLLLLFDFAHSPHGGLRRALDGARVMLREQLHPADRAAVAYYTGTRGVIFVAGFTSDRDQLAVALDLVRELLDRDMNEVRAARDKLNRLRGGEDFHSLASGFGWPAVLAMRGSALPTRSGRSGGGQGAFLSVEAPLDGGFQPFETGPRAPGGILSAQPDTPGEVLARAFQSAGVATIEDFSEAMSDVATLLRDVTGAKHLLLFSGGLGGISAAGYTVTSKLYEFGKIRRAFLRSGWVLHTVSVRGVPGPFSGGMSGNDSLYFIANETGGRMYENHNRFDQATARFLESSSVTYLLTFQPSKLAENGHRHRIEVKLIDGPRGARVTHRPAYYAPKPAKRRNDLEHRLDAVDQVFGEQQVDLIAAATLAVPLGSRATATNPRPGRVPVAVQIDGESLLAGQKSASLELEIQGYALDSAGGVTDFFVEEVDLDLSEVRDRLRRDGVRFFADLDLPPGDYRLRVLVLNEESRRFSLETVPITVAGKSSGTLLPPLFLDLESAPLTVQEEALGNDHFFDFDGVLLFPALEPRIAAGETWPIYVAGYDAGAAEDIEIRVVTGDGAEVRAGHVELDRRLPVFDGVDRFLGTFKTQGLEPGAYRLEIRGADGAMAASGFQVVSAPEKPRSSGVLGMPP